MSSCNKGLTRKEAKNKVFETWSYHFKNNLSSTARKYLTIENDEKSFNLDDCLKISSMCGVPVVFDTFHEECYVHSHPDEIHVPVEENLERLVKTWTSRKKSPMSHVSNQKKGSKVGTHSDFIERLPSILTTYALKCPDGKLWVDVEAKAKEEAIFDLLKKHKH
jgi:UV DNA damage endonuclease